MTVTSCVTFSVNSRIRNIQKYRCRSVQKNHIFKTQRLILIKFWHEVPNINIMIRSEFRQWAIRRSSKIADDCRQLVSFCKSVSLLWFNAGHASAWYSDSVYTHYSFIESQRESSTTWLLPHVTFSVTSRIRNIQKYGGRSVQKNHIFKTQRLILIKFWHEVPNINIMIRSEFRQWAIRRSSKIADDCRQLVSFCKSVSLLWFNAGHASAWYSDSLYTH